MKSPMSGKLIAVALLMSALVGCSSNSNSDNDNDPGPSDTSGSSNWGEMVWDTDDWSQAIKDEE